MLFLKVLWGDKVIDFWVSQLWISILITSDLLLAKPNKTKYTLEGEHKTGISVNINIWKDESYPQHGRFPFIFTFKNGNFVWTIILYSRKQLHRWIWASLGLGEWLRKKSSHLPTNTFLIQKIFPKCFIDTSDQFWSSFPLVSHHFPPCLVHLTGSAPSTDLCRVDSGGISAQVATRCFEQLIEAPILF